MTAEGAAQEEKRRRPLLVIGLVLGGLLLLAIAVIVLLTLFGRSDAGKVKFGTSYQNTGNTFSIKNETTTFSPANQVAWVGMLKNDVTPSTLRRTIARVNSDGTRTIVVNQPVHFTTRTTAKINQVAARESVASLEEAGINPPGTYEVVYYSRGKQEASGSFTITGASPIGKIFFGKSSQDAVIAGVSKPAAFGPKDSITYAAHFTKPQGPGKLQVTFLRVRPNGSTKVVSHGLYDDLRTSGIRVRVNQISVSSLPNYGANRSGVYIMRYYKGKKVLAQGKFTLKLSK